VPSLKVGGGWGVLDFSTGIPSGTYACCLLLSGMNDTRDLSLGDVIHKTSYRCMRPGQRQEPVAAAAVVMVATWMPGTPAELMLNCPFIFLIRDRETGTFLFAGRALNPG